MKQRTIQIRDYHYKFQRPINKLPGKWKNVLNRHIADVRKAIYFHNHPIYDIQNCRSLTSLQLFNWLSDSCRKYDQLNINSLTGYINKQIANVYFPWQYVDGFII